jgi:hypothetical protein
VQIREVCRPIAREEFHYLSQKALVTSKAYGFKQQRTYYFKYDITGALKNNE